jgi:hypothetical protein
LLVDVRSRRIIKAGALGEQSAEHPARLLLALVLEVAHTHRDGSTHAHEAIEHERHQRAVAQRPEVTRGGGRVERRKVPAALVALHHGRLPPGAWMTTDSATRRAVADAPWTSDVAGLDEARGFA